MPRRRCHCRYSIYAALTVLLVIGGVSLAADPPTDSPPRGVTWPDHRALEQRLAALLASDSVDDVSTRLGLLRETLTADPLTLVAYDGLQVPLYELTQRWVAGLDDEAFREYLETFEPIAVREWSVANRQSLDEKIRVSLRHAETKTGGAAMALIAAELIDRGRYAAALTWCRRVREHRLVSADDRRHALLRQIVCHLKLGADDAAVAETLWNEYRDDNTGKPLDSAHDALLTRWVDSNFAAHRRHAEANSVVLPNRIAREPVWQQRSTMISDVQELLKDALSEYREQGWLDLPIVQPLVLGDRAIVPQINRLVCYRLSDGEILWRTPPATSLYEPGGESARDLQNSGFRHMLAQTLVQQVQRDAMTASLSANGKSVFAVREWPSESLSSADATSAGENRNTGSRNSRNRLLAYDLESGEPRWELRQLSPAMLASLDIKVSDEPGSETPAMLFLGPPLAVLSDVYAVAQIDADLILVAIDAANGGVRWSYRLASIADEESHHPPRRGTRALLRHRSGVLYGATARGLVFAFDLSSRSLTWGRATHRDDWDRPGNVQLLRAQSRPDDEWWTGWRDSFLELTDEHLVVATPDMDWLRSFDLTTGQVQWEHPRGEGLFVSERLVSEHLKSQLLVVHPTHVEAIAVADGRSLWRRPTGIPAGRGCPLADSYLLPLQNQMWMRLSLADGRAETTDRFEAQPLGNLVAVADGVLSLQHDQVTMYADWRSAFAAVETARAADPDDLALVRRQARLEFQADRYDESASHWRDYLERQTDAMLLKSARQEFLKVRLAELQRHPDRLPALVDEVTALSQSLEAEPGTQLQLAAAHRRRAEFSESLSLLLQAAEQPKSDREIEHDITARKIRWDRHVQGLILDLLSEADDATREILNRQLADAAAKATASPDGFAPARFADRFSFLPQGQAMRLQTARQWGVGARLHHVELALRELANHSDSATAAQAYLALADVLWEKSFRSDAVTTYRQLQHEFAGQTLPTGESTQQFLKGLSLSERYAQELKEGKADPWSSQPPQVSQSDDHYPESVDWVMLPLDSDRFSLWNRVTVAVDRRGRMLRFHSPDEPAAWELKLPASTSMFRFVYPMHRGWGIGRLLVLQVGSDLLGISPWNERGEAEAEVVWYLEGYPRRQPQLNDLGIRRAPLRVGVAEPMLEVLDQYGRIVGDFGPVGAGQFYLFRNGQLEARETATASLLWERKLIKPFTRCQSDAEFVYLYRPGHREMEIVRAVDGKTVAVRSTPADPAEFFLMQGRHVLLTGTTDDKRITVSWHNLFEGGTVWRREFSAASIPFTADRESLGMLEPDGTLTLLDLKSGEALSSHTVETHENITNIHCTATQRQFIVAISTQLDDPAKLAATELRIDHRRPLINGRLLALDRDGGELLWQRDVGDAAFPLEQPRGVPMLVFNHWENRRNSKDQPQTVGVIRFIDLRTGADIVLSNDEETGEDILQDEGDGWGDHYALTLHPDQSRIEFHSPQKTIAFVYPAAKK